MSRIPQIIQHLSTGRRVLHSLALLLVAGGALFRFGPYGDVKAAAGGVVLPEETITRPTELASFLTDLGEAGRATYATFQFWDLLNPILIGLFSVATIGWLIRMSRLSRGRVVALAVALIAPLADLGENAVLLWAIGAFPTSPEIAGLLPLFSGAKFAGLGATFVLGVSLAILALARRQSGRPATPD